MRNKIILICSLVILVIGELAVIFLLGGQIYNKQTSTAVIINPVKKENIIFPGDGELKNFFEPAPNNVIEEQWREETITQTINSDTLNERFEYTVDKPKDTFRIISLGDSFAYGYGVNTRYNYSEVLEDLLNDRLHCKNFKKFEVINLGVHAYDIEFSVERFRLRGQKYNPDLIIWIIKDDDFYNNESMKANLYGVYLFKNEFGLLPPVAQSYEGIRRKFQEEIDPNEVEALHSINNYYKKSLLFLLYFITSGQRAIVEDFARLREDTYVHKVSDLSDEEMIPHDFHPNKNGHRTFADELFKYVTQNNLIPCD